MQSKYHKEKREKSKKIFDWNLEEKLADEDLKAGRIKVFKNSRKAMQWLRKNGEVEMNRKLPIIVEPNIKKMEVGFYERTEPKDDWKKIKRKIEKFIKEGRRRKNCKNRKIGYPS